jgi:lipoprotein-releasing system ATP-binding protein
LIEITGLRKSFFTPAGELEILRGINLSIEKGEVLGIMGASGVSVSYDATDVFSLPDAELTSFRNTTVGFVFQFHHLMPEFTALENVMMPLLIGGERNRAASEERAAALLGELGLSHRLHHRPGELSGGEQQRAAVARALILSPRVVLADEPTGNLDSATGEELFSLLLKLNRERSITFVIVTHNESLSAQCGRVVEMVDGTVRPLVRD